MTPPELELHSPTHEHGEQVLRWRNHPDVTRWFLQTTVDPDDFLRDWEEMVRQPRPLTRVGVLDGRAVATGSVRVTDGMGQQGHEEELRGREGWIGYSVDPAYAGRGIGTAVARAALELGFGGLGLRRVSAGCFADNTPSWRVMERLGMRREQHGVADSFHAELGWVDGYTYAILAEEWAGATR